MQVFGADYDTPDGTCIRDYIHVDDLADAHLKALDYLAAGGATVEVNVGTGVGSSVLDVIRARPSRCAVDAVPYDIVERRAGDPVATFADPHRAREVLGWTCRTRPRRDRPDRLRLAPQPTLRPRPSAITARRSTPVCAGSRQRTISR